jgi:hypothetical protein
MFSASDEVKKVVALRTEHYFPERAVQAQRADFLAILDTAGSDVSLEATSCCHLNSDS